MTFHLTYFQTFYLVIYVLQIIYSALLGFWLLTYKDSQLSTPGEIVAKRRMTRAVGIFVLAWTFELLIYLLPTLYSDDMFGIGNRMCFLTSLMLSTSLFNVVISAILQKRTNVARNSCAIGMPFLIIGIWYVATGQTSLMPFYAAGCIEVVCIIAILLIHIRDYRNYVKCLRSEYSDITSRDVLWAWWCFVGIALQMVVFVAYQLYWNITIECIYTGMTIANAACICYCTSKHRPIDNSIEAETADEAIEEDLVAASQEEKEDDKAFYGIVEEKLELLREREQFFLEPDLTRESLCQRLSIGRTYLSMYLHSRGLTFYQYINTLRLDHAIKLMEEHPEIPVREVSVRSGFRSQTTFRKVFQEMMGCLPSEMRNKPT